MKKPMILAAAAVMSMAFSMVAQDNNADAPRINTDNNLGYENGLGGHYRADEFSIDVFGTDSFGKYTLTHPSGNRIRHDSRLGAGLGANYFVTRYVGFGADAYTDNTAHNFVDNVGGSLILRLPIDELGLAPYAFGGGGHQFDPQVATFVHAGAGLEWRFAHNLGIFVDG